MKAGQDVPCEGRNAKAPRLTRRQLGRCKRVARDIACAAVLLFLMVWSPWVGRRQPPAQALMAQGGGQNASGRSIRVPAGADLQAALDAANPGDTLILEAGATYIGNFKLSNKAGDSYITVTTSALGSLPPAGVRISPSYAPYLPKVLAARGDAALIASKGAHHYRIVGIELGAAPRVDIMFDIVKIGLGTETDAGSLPHDIVLDRVYIHGDPTTGAKRGIALNGVSIIVENSYISDIKWLHQEAQAICGWNGPGPFKILNNYLEGAGENIMFGGAVASIRNLVPSDIEVRHNYLYKPLSWRKEDRSYAGSAWTVKNLFELKNAQRVTVDGNVMENNWTMAQNGTAVLFTPRAEGGRLPWDVVQDVTFTHNIVRHVGSVFSILAIDDTDKTTHGIVRLHRVLIRDNLFEDVSRATWVGYGSLYGLWGPVDGVTIDHNTGFPDGFVALSETREPSTGFSFTNNIALHGLHGFAGSGLGEGSPVLAKSFPGAVFARNVIIGGDPSRYPPGNFFPASLSQVGFVDHREGKYQLAPSSRYRNAGTDRKDIGADIRALDAAVAGVVEGRWETSSAGPRR